MAFLVIFLIEAVEPPLATGLILNNTTKTMLCLLMCVAESSLLSDVAYVMCLDSVGSGSELFVHVSKPPKNDSAVDFLLKV